MLMLGKDLFNLKTTHMVMRVCIFGFSVEENS